jgi:hypothetical protein
MLRPPLQKPQFHPHYGTQKPFALGQENNYFLPIVVIVLGAPAADLLL